MIRRYKYRSQFNMQDCGVAALATILENYNLSYSIAELRRLAKTTEEGTTILGITKAAESLGMDTKAIKADESLLDIENLYTPFIAHVLKENSLLHYYVVYKVNKNTIIIADPDPKIGIKRINRKDFLKEWTGYSIFITPNSKANDYINNRKTNIFSLIPLVFKNKKILINIFCATLVVTFITILTSLFLKIVIDEIIPSASLNILAIISLGLIIAQVLQKILEYGKNFLLIVLSQRFSIDITLEYIKRLFEIPISYYYTRSIGDVVSRFQDLSTLINAMASLFISSILDILILIIISIILFFQIPQLFFILLFIVPIFITIIILFIKPFEEKKKKTLEANAKLSTSIVDSLYGMETIKALNKEGNRYEKIDREFIDYLKEDFSYSNANNLQSILKQSVQILFSTILLWLGSHRVIINDITIGELMTFNALLVYFFNPLENIINLQPQLQAGKVAFDRIQDAYTTPPEDEEIENNNYSFTNGSIQFCNVYFKYGYTKNILENINMIINKGDKVTITGNSGSGKSTLAKLIVRFYNLDKGNIKIGGTDISKMKTNILRENIVYLPQQPYIFTGTIWENLFIEDTDITFKEVSEIMEFVKLKKEIENMPMGYNTKISSDGSGLSGGQKQRLALARALLLKSDILILDEATSSLDENTEEIILNNLIGMKDKTIIFIAHGSKIAKKSDKVFFIDKGTIVDSGTYFELLENDGDFKKLQNGG